MTDYTIKQVVKQQIEALPEDCSMDDVLNALKTKGALNLPVPFDDNLLTDQDAKTLSDILRKWIIQ